MGFPHHHDSDRWPGAGNEIFEAGRPPAGAASPPAGLWPASGRPVAASLSCLFRETKKGTAKRSAKTRKKQDFLGKSRACVTGTLHHTSDSAPRSCLVFDFRTYSKNVLCHLLWGVGLHGARQGPRWCCRLSGSGSFRWRHSLHSVAFSALGNHTHAPRFLHLYL